MIKPMLTRFNLKLSGIFNWFRNRDIQQLPRPEANSFEMFVIPSEDTRNERNNQHLQLRNQNNDLNKLHENPNTDQHAPCNTSTSRQ